ncbi:MAG: NnrS family protein [Rhodocyclaceae bacterium]
MSAAHPLWLCGFRSFFLLTALSGALLVLLWGAFLAHGAPLPAVVGGVFVWHAHELIFGFALASVAGFSLTAIPEFTRSAPVAPRTVRTLAGLWLFGRAAFWLSGHLGTAGIALSALAHGGLLAGLIAVLGPRLWNDPQRRHLGFLWSLLALAVVVAGFYVDALRGQAPARWLDAALGVLMILIVVSMSRISMSIVNGALDAAGGKDGAYLARPPRRNLAITCIALYTAAQFVAPGAALGGWLALAAAAALFHLQGDWHVGRALRRRWPLMLFGVYLLMAAGYGTIGLALLAGNGESFSAGRHLLTAGALGLNVYVVLNIAGRIHAGYPLDRGRWVPAGAALLVLAALLRAAAAWPGADARLLMAAASVLWTLPFACFSGFMWPIYSRPRKDHGSGCAGITGEQGN